MEANSLQLKNARHLKKYTVDLRHMILINYSLRRTVFYRNVQRTLDFGVLLSNCQYLDMHGMINSH